MTQYGRQLEGNQSIMEILENNTEKEIASKIYDLFIIIASHNFQ
jgi:hypothetical protein